MSKRPTVVIPQGPSQADGPLTNEVETAVTAGSARARRSATLRTPSSTALRSPAADWSVRGGDTPPPGDTDAAHDHDHDHGGPHEAPADTPSINVGISAFVSLLRRNRAYRWLWIGGFISGLGTWFNEIATVVILQRYTSSAFMMSLYFILRLVSAAAFSPVGGVITDALPKIYVLIACDLVATVAVCAYLLVQSAETLWIVYVNVVAIGCISAVMQPCKSALVAEVVGGGDDLELANALSSMSSSSTFAVGSALSGLATGVLGTSPAYIIDALTFALSAVCMVVAARVMSGRPAAYAVLDEHAPPPDTPIAGESDEDEPFAETEPLSSGPLGWIRAYGHGVAFMVVREPTLLLCALLSAAFKFADASGDLIVTRLAEHEYSLGLSNSGMALGLTFLSLSLGIVAGPFAMRRFQAARYGVDVPISGRLLFAEFGFGLASLAFAIIGLQLSMAAYFAALSMLGAGLIFIYLPMSVVLQKMSPAYVRGRVLATSSSMRLFAGALGFYLSSMLLDKAKWTEKTVELVLSTAPCVVACLACAIARRRALAREALTNTTSSQLTVTALRISDVSSPLGASLARTGAGSLLGASLASASSLASVSSTGDASPFFVLVAAPGLPHILAPGEAVDVAVAFTPHLPGPYHALLTVQPTAGSPVMRIALVGSCHITTSPSAGRTASTSPAAMPSGVHSSSFEALWHVHRSSIASRPRAPSSSVSPSGRYPRPLHPASLVGSTAYNSTTASGLPPRTTARASPHSPSTRRVNTSIASTTSSFGNRSSTRELENRIAHLENVMESLFASSAVWNTTAPSISRSSIAYPSLPPAPPPAVGSIHYAPPPAASMSPLCVSPPLSPTRSLSRSRSHSHSRSPMRSPPKPTFHSPARASPPPHAVATPLSTGKRSVRWAEPLEQKPEPSPHLVAPPSPMRFSQFAPRNSPLNLESGYLRPASPSPFYSVTPSASPGSPARAPHASFAHTSNGSSAASFIAAPPAPSSTHAAALLEPLTSTARIEADLTAPGLPLAPPTPATPMVSPHRVKSISIEDLEFSERKRKQLLEAESNAAAMWESLAAAPNTGFDSIDHQAKIERIKRKRASVLQAKARPMSSKKTMMFAARSVWHESEHVGNNENIEPADHRHMISAGDDPPRANEAELPLELLFQLADKENVDPETGVLQVPNPAVLGSYALRRPLRELPIEASKASRSEGEAEAEVGVENRSVPAGAARRAGKESKRKSKRRHKLGYNRVRGGEPVAHRGPSAFARLDRNEGMHAQRAIKLR
ncbi:uncharacterized protein AMSG_12434 [Thecamonas trahens ATCC 50062]|uniref:Major facilitator superfamily (MFS) profile domain-containing protein n=1 Tax=Thecamonas trahens ATCC 50062 TaxID=461836 RepID=A0A0L0DUV5_THETB|nr:hypothetical protein AMSG_12434 [Thecamonas trahens ATCC 50062]KNC55856.1 hypothetical protein AMSG_12434 [Thecamonas trahens ATCC 50062]|eukprot:XP_013752796.1 hypothetical protein AMSG_12434 [Thecamonas trahens ATCC 50062]